LFYFKQQFITYYLITTNTGTECAKIDENLVDYGSVKNVNIQLIEPNDEEDSEKDGVGQGERRQVITWTAQFVSSANERDEIEAVAQHSHSNHRTQIVEIEKLERFYCQNKNCVVTITQISSSDDAAVVDDDGKLITSCVDFVVAIAAAIADCVIIVPPQNIGH